MLDLGAYGETAPPSAPPPPRPPRRLPHLSRRAWALVVAAVLVAGADVAVAALRHRAAVDDAGPRATAQAFYDAVGRQDAAAALATLDPSARADGRLLTASALSAKPGLTQADAALVSEHGDDATVGLSYSVTMPAGDFGEPVFASMTLTLHRTFDGVLHDHARWRITGGLPVVQIELPAYVQQVTVAGTPIALEGGRATVTTFPGLVPLTTAATPFVTAGTEDLVGGAPSVVPATEDQGSTVLGDVRPEVTSAAGAAVDATFARRTDQLPDVTQELIGSDGFEVAPDGRSIQLFGAIEEQDAAGVRDWDTTTTVTVGADGSLRYATTIARSSMSGNTLTLDPSTGDLLPGSTSSDPPVRGREP